MSEDNTQKKLLPNSLLPIALPAAIGAVSAIMVSCTGGYFSVEKESVTHRGARELEQQKFSYELIRKALAEPKRIDQANALLLLVDFGLLPNLNAASIRDYANREKERINKDPEAPSILPRLGASLLDIPQYNERMPASGGTKAGRALLEVALGELNRGVHELRDGERVREYLREAGLPAPLEIDAPWSGAFLYWALNKSGNPERFPRTALNYTLWKHAHDRKLTFMPHSKAVQPGDIAVWFRGGPAGVEAIRRGSSFAGAMHIGIVHGVEGENFAVISGNARDAVRLSRHRLQDASLVGFVRLPDAQ